MSTIEPEFQMAPRARYVSGTGDDMLELATMLPALLPSAVAWAEASAAEVAARGTLLSPQGMALASRVGVTEPHRIRIGFVPAMPLPQDPMLREAIRITGLLGFGTVGLTLGHSIDICHGRTSLCLLAHEFRHVYQYEQAGSIAAFLPAYLQQILQYGYEHCPLEMDARARESAGEQQWI